MPRYLIERIFGEVDEQELQQIGTRSKRLVLDEFPDVTWEHSHVVVDEDGGSRSFCVYTAPDEATVRQHGARLGFHAIGKLYEIGGDVSPEDFPTSSD